MVINAENVLNLAKKHARVSTAMIADTFNVSRQYAAHITNQLVANQQLIKIGATRGTFYILPETMTKNPLVIPTELHRRYTNKNLEEHVVLESIEEQFPLLATKPEHIRSIFVYAFSEMFNNAIEHSHSSAIDVKISINHGLLTFTIADTGIGVFRSIMEHNNLSSVQEAIQDLLKGKTTTQPRSHSGEGIFFTSKIADSFTLDSFGTTLHIDNTIQDIKIGVSKRKQSGTRVIFSISLETKKHLNDVFRAFTSEDTDGTFGFDKTEIQVKLYTIGGIYISRSQARRVLSGLEKFRVVVFDFDRVSMIGQAFADELFRVFQLQHPDIRLEIVNANESVQFMINRARATN